MPGTRRSRALRGRRARAARVRCRGSSEPGRRAADDLGRRLRPRPGQRPRPSCYRLADGALYWAKAHGRDTTRRYTPEVGRGALGRGARRAPGALARPWPASARWRAPSTRRTRPRSATPSASPTSPRSSRSALGWSLDGGRERCATPASCTTSARSASRTRSCSSPAASTREEYEQVKGHAALGAQIVDDVLLPEQVPWVRHHHERWDGARLPGRHRGRARSRSGARILGGRRRVGRDDERAGVPSARSCDEALDGVPPVRRGQF